VPLKGNKLTGSRSRGKTRSDDIDIFLFADSRQLCGVPNAFKNASSSLKRMKQIGLFCCGNTGPDQPSVTQSNPERLQSIVVKLPKIHVLACHQIFPQEVIVPSQATLHTPLELIRFEVERAVRLQLHHPSWEVAVQHHRFR